MEWHKSGEEYISNALATPYTNQSIIKKWKLYGLFGPWASPKTGQSVLSQALHKTGLNGKTEASSEKLTHRVSFMFELNKRPCGLKSKCCFFIEKRNTVTNSGGDVICPLAGVDKILQGNLLPLRSARQLKTPHR